MLKDVVLEIFGEAWPMIIIFTIILSSIRISYLIINKEKFILYKELSSLLFIIYISSLFYIVTFQDNNYGMSNVIPFKEIFRYSVESEAFFKNVIGNILLYMPFGLFVSAHLNNKKIFPTLFLTIIASLTVETVQLVIGRVFDVDDIILNVVGGTLGAYTFIILDKFRGRLPRILKQEWFMNLIVIILLLIGILYFTNLSSYIYEMVK
jgi:glycopeptide antibiotics resistance protein